MRTNDDETPGRSSAKREILILGLGAVVGLMVLPVVVYYTGTALLGGYGTGGLPRFYANLLQDLAHGTLNSWLLVLLPYVALRILWLLVTRPSSQDTPPPRQAVQPARHRREPTVS